MAFIISKSDWYQLYNDYYLDVNLAAIELSKEYGPRAAVDWCWSWGAAKAGCAASTFKKYYDPHFELPSWYLEEQKVIAAKEAEKRKIEKNAQAQGQIVKWVDIDHFDPKNEKLSDGAIVLHDLNSVPTSSGVYLIGQAEYDTNNNRVFYMLKVGKATNLKRRLRDYNTHNPGYELFGIQKTDMIDAAEMRWHTILSHTDCLAMGDNMEWFIVSRDTYLKAKKFGFKGLK